MDKESFNCITNTLKQLAVRRPDTFDGINTGVDRELTLCWHDQSTFDDRKSLCLYRQHVDSKQNLLVDCGSLLCAHIASRPLKPRKAFIFSALSRIARGS